VREGEPADALYLLISGAAQASTVRGDGGARVLGELRSGAVFGEIGLLERIPRTATVTTLERSRLLRIDGDAFLEALTSDPLAALIAETARARMSRSSAPEETLEPVA
jgi:CRP-like cAMP-binding protein